MNIGKNYFKNGIFLAPMAGVTDRVFREICKDMGCELTYTEMVSAKGLYYGSENTEELLKISKKESPAAVQIFGSDPYIMAKVIERFNNDDNICIIDINMGCPVNKIVKNGEGSALMKNPKLAYEIVKEMKKATNKPVTAKFRKGFDEDNINAVDFAKTLEDAGIDAIAVHGRTRKQMYEGKSDLDIIKKVKENVTIPVIGNGDIFSFEDALKMKKYTNCDGVMVARGSMGNPWIFNQINSILNDEVVNIPMNEEKINMCIKHYKKALDEYGEIKTVKEMRGHISWYIKGMKNSAYMRNIINREEDSDKVLTILDEYKKELGYYEE